MTVDVLTRRQLNRATLERQLLLERSDVGVVEAVTHLAGLQAQEPPDPTIALWSRLRGFRPDALGRALEDRQVARIVAMRGTVHLLAADDVLPFRAMAQPVLEREMVNHQDHKAVIAGLDDLAPVVELGAGLLDEGPVPIRQLRTALAERFPDATPGALVLVLRNRLPLVQAPPRGVWGHGAAISYVTATSWLDRAPAGPPPVEQVVLRYLSAFGPGSVADCARWSRLTALREVFDRLAPQLRPFRDERGRELWDLPDAPRPDPDVPAPVRFLPQFDNALLSHHDRTRFVPDDLAGTGATESNVMWGTVLVDGMVVARWRTDPTTGAGDATGELTVEIAGFVPLPARVRSSIGAEARRLVRALHPRATLRDVAFLEG
jgi:hypothetical protein